MLFASLSSLMFSPPHELTPFLFSQDNLVKTVIIPLLWFVPRQHPYPEVQPQKTNKHSGQYTRLPVYYDKYQPMYNGTLIMSWFYSAEVKTYVGNVWHGYVCVFWQEVTVKLS